MRNRAPGHLIPGALTISEAGKPVVEARTESVTDPVAAGSALFDPSGMAVAGSRWDPKPSRARRPKVGRTPALFETSARGSPWTRWTCEDRFFAHPNRPARGPAADQ